MKKLHHDWRIYAAFALIAVTYLVYSCSRPTEVEREREISYNTHAIFTLLSEDARTILLSTDSDSFAGWFRTPHRDDNPIPMIDAIAYNSDFEVGGRTFITAINDGDKWHASALLPDGTSHPWADITYHAVYEDEFDCFVCPWPLPGWVLCGTKEVYITYLRRAICDYPGLWQMSFYKNDVQYHEGEFTVLPHIEPGTVPSGSFYNQGTYFDIPYDSICHTIDPENELYHCDGRAGEIKYTIKNKGCALVSGVIILNYYGIDVSPVELNDWMNQNHGYADLGGIRFNKIAEYALKVGQKNISRTPELDYATRDQLQQYICTFGPQVLDVGHHYVVAFGMDNEETTFLIVDPDSGVVTTLADKYNDFYERIRCFRGPDFSPNYSTLEIRLHSPGELLIESPSGDKTGYDPISGAEYSDIPHSSYNTDGMADLVTGDPGPTTKVLEIMLPEDGDYSLVVTGTAEGTYELEVYGCDENFEANYFLSDEIPIYNEAVHQYCIQYDQTTGDFFKIEGGYDGDSQRKWDVNQLLSYFTIASKTVRLPSGIMEYALGITYHEDVDADSFTATLNDADISSMFNPVPDSSEIVTIDLSQGSNSLVLTIEGDVPSRRNIDTDKFEIIATP